MDFRAFLKQHILRLDGGMGTLLQAEGLTPGEHPERWNLTRPEVITAIHKAYYEAGSHVVSTNTFGANSLKFDAKELEAILAAAVQNARNAPGGEGVCRHHPAGCPLWGGRHPHRDHERRL